ncbi:PRA1 family protein B4-like [Lycium ferocissimum]|uniref:PRA1 family protein B4-like n=1 Tax=Lycium ferocissimum TaxID=112874 RepID=UPI002815D6F4|nr:PRA1 family protein B4-like [Lycium ferocissimum]
MATPAILPMSNPQPPSTTTTTTTTTQITPTPAFRSFINHISTTIQTGFTNRKPWSELLDRSAFSKPESISDASLRIRRNYSYFRVNYLSILTLILAFSLITNPFSLLTLTALLAAWVFLYLFRPSDTPLVVFGREFSERETLGVLFVSTVVVIFLTSVGAVLVSALMVGVGVVCLHAAFRTPEDLFLDDQESPATGFLSFLSGGGPANTSVAVAPPVAARV